MFSRDPMESLALGVAQRRSMQNPMRTSSWANRRLSPSMEASLSAAPQGQIGFFRELFGLLSSWGYDRIAIDAVVGKRKVMWRTIEGLSFSPSMIQELMHRYETTGEVSLARRDLPTVAPVDQNHTDEGSR